MPVCTHTYTIPRLIQRHGPSLEPDIQTPWNVRAGLAFLVPSSPEDLVSLPPTHLSQEHSCVINIGVGKNLDMLNNLISFLDPVFAKHLSEWTGFISMGLEPGQLKIHHKPSPRAVGKMIAKHPVFPMCLVCSGVWLSVSAPLCVSSVFSNYGLLAGTPFLSLQKERVQGLCSPSSPGSASASSVLSSPLMMSGGSGR